MNLREALKNDFYFEEYMHDWFDKKGELSFGYNDGYYWEEWTVNPNRYGTCLVVDFHIGSGSGWIETNDHVESITYEDFRNLLLNKKFENDDVDLVKIIEEETEDLK